MAGLEWSLKTPMRVLRRESAVVDAPVSSPDGDAGRPLDAERRARLLALLKGELTRASHRALSDGMTTDDLSAQLDDRIARLRAQITKLSEEDPPPDRR